MILALRERALDLGLALTSEDLHKVAGLPDRYIPKLLSPAVAYSAPARQIGYTSLGPLLGVLAVKIDIIADESAEAKKVLDRLPRSKRKRTGPNAVASTERMSRKYMSKIGKLGGHARHSMIVKERLKRAKHTDANRRHLEALGETERRRRWREAKRNAAQSRKLARDAERYKTQSSSESLVVCTPGSVRDLVPCDGETGI